MENKISILSKIKDIYDNGGNIIQYLKDLSDQEENTVEDILISYDFQAGSYIEYANKNVDFLVNYTSLIAKEIKKLNVKVSSLIEIGVGEATTLVNTLSHLTDEIPCVYGLDISWSRIYYAENYLKTKKFNNINLFTADLFNIPLSNDSVDIVYTSHSLEPNGGREVEALRELYRITNKYLILLEPAYEFADEESKNRMNAHGYVKNLTNIAQNLGYCIIENRLFELSSNKNNPTQIIIIEKNKNALSNSNVNFICPITKSELFRYDDCMFSKQGLLAYPIIKNIPCLLSSNAIVATHFEDFL